VLGSSNFATARPNIALRTVGHAHRNLHWALEPAVKVETLARTVSAAVPPPEPTIEILDEVQLEDAVPKLRCHPLSSSLPWLANVACERYGWPSPPYKTCA